jgi:CRISPR-associated endonuclease/helicase Cas3
VLGISFNGVNLLVSLDRLDKAAAIALAGFVSVADWVASNKKFFSYCCLNGDVTLNVLKEYAQKSRESAVNALRELHWDTWSPPSEKKGLCDLFKAIQEPRPVQVFVEETIGPQIEPQSEPSIVIIESPMGEGKTEAAVYLADLLCASQGQKGCYFALPTQATSNQMFGRIKDYLLPRFPGKNLNLMLLHGLASLSAEFESSRGEESRALAGIGEDEDDRMDETVRAAEWFTYRKRGFLAPFGVGTIDQALLSVLRTKHFFVRLFGLSHKTIIIDEVHAYDTYMTTLLERLLEWLAALRSSVVLLSATLPKEKRKELIKAYLKGLGIRDEEPNLSAKYPRVTWTVGNKVNEEQVETSELNRRSITLEWVDGGLPTEPDGDFKLGCRLKEVLGEGGCAAVVCNTVNRAQKIYKELKRYFKGEELDLFHARFLWKDRQEREKRTIEWFGPDGSSRPKRMVLVATQVIEQSLDLDFDLMVTDIAPVDLILQRAGRLHRHKRSRPEGLKEPVLWICKPDETDPAPKFDSGDEAVYNRHILLRTWLALRDRKTIRIPEDVEKLIDDTYTDKVCPEHLPEEITTLWTNSKDELDKIKQYEENEAEERYIKPPSFSGDISKIAEDPLEEDAPDLHEKLRALTRLAPQTVDVICLQKNSSFDPNSKPDAEQIKELMNHSIPVSHKDVVKAILKNPPPVGWQKSPLLRNHRLIPFDENGVAKIGRFRLCLDKELGLVIE